MEVSGKKILRQWEQKVTIEEPWEFARSLVAMNVRLLICGAIPRYFFDWFQLKEVCVIADQRGPVQEILDKLLQ
ncbi:MAG: hypothetical protein COS92_00725 [Desulfobacterales bacterium CG07_land_8_20_14_0_80_52_14]|nr:MAG: hypothetical protein COS92_00725 [Desulfobacterales bacterium CG07_land_8_20_14_0_80_52_14]